jgi:hypothetical protein
MLRSWTRIDFMTLLGPNINLPRNAIYLTTVEHRTFGQFKLYLDKEAVSRFRVFIIPSLALIHSVSGHAQQVQSAYAPTPYASKQWIA